MKYQVVHEIANGEYVLILELERKVNALCAEGWKPEGGIFVMRTGDSYSAFSAFQAMVKEE